MNRPPNILFLVWDACRPDYAAEHAQTLTALAEDNRWFERAVTPAPWSLPAHASLFSGVYPSKHGRTQLGDDLDGLPLVPQLSADGYRCYGVSANGFACQRTGFHEGFDEFYYTRGRERFHDGLDVSGTALATLREGHGTIEPALATTLGILTHAHPIKSVANAVAVALGSLAVRQPALQWLPHPLFAPDSGYVYDPAANTSRLADLIKRAADDDQPFFAFANYMDTHRPYKPTADKQQTHLGRTLPRAELERVNEEVAAPWPFLASDARGEVSERDIETLRGLYAGEVETVDDHLARLLEVLEMTDQREETLVVVTSDHGEYLGESDERGYRRMGHEASVGNLLARVPLVVAHPDIEPGRVARPFSLTNLVTLFTDGRERFLSSGGDPETVRSEEVVSCQYPAAGGDQLYEKYPETPRAALDYRVREHGVAAYNDDWRVGRDTTGDNWAVSTTGDDGDPPANLVEACMQQLDALVAADRGQEALSESDVTQLEALGYL
ncbi:sulfatase-like hydrolase/transferase [Haloarcula sp. GH36]|uniref:sulfatase-like hydrolase/transferase n=1 Tax=Haloarcula montana TaxID=3111776 RepID=UPI002D76F765|nr:sulfatase-like hydrolase/transferase [Haloarcula sp. GH36]